MILILSKILWGATTMLEKILSFIDLHKDQITTCQTMRTPWRICFLLEPKAGKLSKMEYIERGKAVTTPNHLNNLSHTDQVIRQKIKRRFSDFLYIPQKTIDCENCLYYVKNHNFIYFLWSQVIRLCIDYVCI
jgi:hypothetical protein